MRTIIILTIGFLAGYWYSTRRRSSSIKTTGGQGESVGLNDRRHAVKEAAKTRVLELFLEKPEIRNDDVEHALGVSDATATNYLQELKDEGKIVQIGQEGRFITYRLNA